MRHSCRAGCRRVQRRTDRPRGGPLPVFPGRRRGRALGRPLVHDTQGAVHDLEAGATVAGHRGQPPVIAGPVVDAVQLAGDTAQQRHGDLGAKARAQAQGVLHRVAAAARQVEIAQLLVGPKVAVDVGHRGHDTVLHGLDRQDVLDPDAHGVAGVALGIGDHDLAGLVAKGAAQGMDLGRCAPAARGGVGLVRDKHRVRRDLVAADAKACFGLPDDAIHDRADVIDVEPRAVVGAVGDLAGQHLADAAHAALAHGILGLDDDRSGAHADDRAVAATVKGQSRLVQALLGRRRSGGEQARSDPAHQVIAGHVVAGDDDHAPAAAGADPVFGHGDGVRGGGAGGIDVRVGAARADVLGKLGVAHRQDAEDKAAVKVIVEAQDLVFEARDAAIEIGRQAIGPGDGPRAELLQHLQLVGERLVLVVTCRLLGHAVQAGEGRGKDHAGLVGQRFGQHPAVGQEGALAGGPVAHDQRDASVAQRLDPGGDGQLGRDVERFDARLGHAVLGYQVKVAAPPGELDRVGGIVDHLKDCARGMLDQAVDALPGHVGALPVGDQLDELLATQQPLDVLVVEYLAVLPGQADRGPADHDRSGQWQHAITDRGLVTLGLRRRHALVDALSLIEEIGKEAAEGRVGVLTRRLARGCARLGRGGFAGCRFARCHGHGFCRSLWLDGSWRGGNLCRRLRLRLNGLARAADAGGIEAAQRLVQAGQGTLARVVGKENGRIAGLAEDVLRQGLEHALGTHLDIDPGSLAVEGLDALDELDGRGDLLAQDLDDLGRRRRVALAGDVGHDRDARRADLHVGDDALERFARRGDDLGVKSVRNRDLDGALVGRLEGGDRVVDGGGGAADHDLGGAVDVGQHHVAIDPGQHLFYLRERGKDGGHTAVVFHRDLAHLAAARAHDQQGVGKGEHAARHQGRVFAQAVPDHHLWHDAKAAQQAGQGDVDGQHRRLGDGRVLESLLSSVDRPLVLGIDKDIVGQGATKQGRHDIVRLAEGVGDDRIELAQLAHHVHVLRALPGEHKGDLAGRAAAAKDALCRERTPYGRIRALQRLERLGTALEQFLGISIVDRQALGRDQCPRVGRLGRRGLARTRHTQHRLELGLQAGYVIGAEQQRASERGLELGGPGLGPAVASTDGSGAKDLLGGQHARDVLLEHDVEIGPAKAKGADASTAHAVGLRRLTPGSELGLHVKGQVVKVDVRVGPRKVGVGQQRLVVQGQDGLEQARCAGGTLEVADVGLDRAERDAAGAEVELGKDVAHALGLDHVADARRGAVPLDVRDSRQGEAGTLPGALDRLLWPDRVGGSDALTLAVAGPADAPDDGIDPVAIALGVGEALEQQDGGPLAHDKAVGALGIGARAVGAEGADLGELDKAVGVHVAVDAAGEDGVEMPGQQALDRGFERGERGGTGRIGDKVGPAQVEDVGHAPGDDVR